MKPILILRARSVLPMVSPAITDGVVAFSGNRILAVGPDHEVCRHYPKKPVLDLGDSVLMPGLINAHAHLEIPGPVPDISAHPPFVQWVLALLTRLRPANDPIAQLTRTLTSGVMQSMRSGVTTIADITRQPAITRPILSKLPLRIISFGEIRAMGQRRNLLEEQIAAAVGITTDQSTHLSAHAADSSPNLSSDQRHPARLTHGLSPHAPYSVEPAGYARCVEEARTHNLPLMTHLAETFDEAEFLNHHAGRLMNIWQHLGGWDDQIPRFDGSPIEFAHSVGLMAARTLLAHVNYCDDEQMQRLAGSSASVVYCPRTHAYFGHPPHRWRQMMDAGINLCLGTDSRASSDDLNLLADLRLLRSQVPELPAENLMKLVTTNAAQALGRDDLGRLAPGCMADLVCYPLLDDQRPLEPIVRDPQLAASALWVDGLHVPIF